MKALAALRNLLLSVTRRSGDVVEKDTGWLDFGSFRSDPGWFQKALDEQVVPSSTITTNTAVYACTNIIAQEVASLRVYHYRVDPKTRARQRVLGSMAERVLRRPNAYQTRSDFWLYLLRSLLLSGNGIGACERNRRDEVSAIHPLPPTSCRPLVGPGGEVFYNTSPSNDGLYDISNTMLARDVLHLRLNCHRHPLLGETPVASFAYSAATGNAIQRSVSRFFGNMSRPSGLLTTPKPLTAKQVDELRESWKKVTTGYNIGGTPVLHSDLKWEAITMSATDAETIESYRLSVADIAMAYRIPLFMLGDLSKATFKNVESLMRVFYTSSLRFYLEHIENALNSLFELDGDSEYLEFDIESGLLRGDLESRINAWTKAVQGGVMTPNEARIREELPPQDGGDNLFLQRQMVPIASIAELLELEIDKLGGTTTNDTGADVAGDTGADVVGDTGDAQAQEDSFEVIVARMDKVLA